jgi:hypothetical protein
MLKVLTNTIPSRKASENQPKEEEEGKDVTSSHISLPGPVPRV